MPDFGFVGPSYEAPSIYQDAQESINWFIELDKNKPPEARGYSALYPTPGLVSRVQLFYGEVRGLFTVSGGQTLIAVSSNLVYKIDTNLVATQIGTLNSFSGIVSITNNITNVDGLVVYIVDGADRYTWVQNTNIFSILPPSDGPWQGASVVDEMDNYFLYNEVGTQNWACSDLGSRLSTNAFFGTKDGYADKLVTFIVDRRQVYLLGEVTSEVWTDVGSVISGITTFPFQRIPGTSIQSGIAAPFSLSRFGNSFAFVSQDTRGNSTIEMVDGYTFVKISTHAVEQSLLNQTISDARSFTYQLEGHEMYVVTFPSIGNGLTWVYDLSTGQWHKWLHWNNGQYFRHRGNCGAFFNNMYLIGDFENGKIYSIENAVYTDDGSTIRRLRRAPHLVTDFDRQFFEEFQIQFQPGVGNPVDPGQNPQAMLRWSDDGGSTWSNVYTTSIGKIGNYINRAIFRRLGTARDRIFEVSISDPVKAVIVSANLKASVGVN